MKKTISIMLAVIMIFTLAMPSFAALDKDNTSGNSEIITNDVKADGTSGASWEVEYPASTTLDWETLVADDGAKIEYTSKAHLYYNQTLTVNVAPSATSKMVHKDDNAYSLAYTLKAEDGTSALADTVLGPVGEATTTFRVDVPLSEWNAAPVGTYSDLLTFTATVA